MKAGMPLAERRRLEGEQQAEIGAALAPLHFAAVEDEQAIAANWLAHAFEAGPVIRVMLARLGHGFALAHAPVAISEPRSVANIGSGAYSK